MLLGSGLIVPGGLSAAQASEAPEAGTRPRVEVLRSSSDWSSVTVSKAADGAGRPIDVLLPKPRRPAGSQLRQPSASALQVPQSMLVTRGRITSGTGMRFHPVLGTARMHSGVDLAAPTGAPVVTTADGLVRVAGWSGGYGLLVVVDHGSGLQSRYGHLLRIAVSPGQQVRAGSVLGYVGSTGRSTGPHLHYELRYHSLVIDPVASRRPIRPGSR